MANLALHIVGGVNEKFRSLFEVFGVLNKLHVSLVHCSFCFKCANFSHYLEQRFHSSVFGFSPACVENQLLELVMDPKEGIECKGYARHDAKGDLVPFKFLRRSRPQLAHSEYTPITRVCDDGPKF